MRYQICIRRSVLTTKWTSSTKTTAAKEALKHLFWTEFILPHTTTHTATGSLPLTEPTKWILRLCLCLTEPAIRISTESIVFVPLLFIPQHTESPCNHFESLVGVLVAVLVRVCEQGLFAICLFDLCLGTALAHGLYVENFVEVRGLALADAKDGSFLLRSVFAILVALIVFAVAGCVFRGIRPRGGCAGRHGAPVGQVI